MSFNHAQPLKREPETLDDHRMLHRARAGEAKSGNRSLRKNGKNASLRLRNNNKFGWSEYYNCRGFHNSQR